MVHPFRNQIARKEVSTTFSLLEITVQHQVSAYLLKNLERRLRVPKESNQLLVLYCASRNSLIQAW